MGLAGVKAAWQRQTKHFGHDSSQYSVLILDNRGMGESDKPWRRYTTSAMALDCIDILQHIGWLNPTDPSPKRSLHLIGISLGGMISQEIAHRIPQHLASLTLLCTAAAVENTKPWYETLVERSSMFIPKTMDAQILITARQLFPEEWLRGADESVMPSPKGTPRCGPAPGTPDGEYLRFESNFQRFQAQELVKRLNPSAYTMWGLTLQLGAAALHHKSEAQLTEMADRIGRERISILHGTKDEMIDVVLGEKLIKMVKPGTSLIVEGMGHAPVLDRAAWVNERIETHIGMCEGIKDRE